MPSQTVPCLTPNSCCKWAHVCCYACQACICFGYISEEGVDVIFRQRNRSHNLMRCATKMFVCKPVIAQLNVKCVGFTWAFCNVSLFLYLCACKPGLERGWFEAEECNILAGPCEQGAWMGFPQHLHKRFLMQDLLSAGLCSRSAEVKVKCFRRNFKWTSSECVGRSTLQNYS